MLQYIHLKFVSQIRHAFHSRVIPQYSVRCGGEIQRHLSCYSLIDICHSLLVTY